MQEAFDPFECHHYELPEYADKKYGWGVALLGDSREGPAFYASHGPENQGMTTEQTAPRNARDQWIFPRKQFPTVQESV